MTPQQRRAFVDGYRPFHAPIDIEADDIERELKGCETRFACRVEIGSMWRGGLGVWYEQEVLYKGKWLTVGQTDLFDDVRTGHCAPSEEQQGLRVETLAGESFGVRLSERHMSFITHMTDG
jgi:hypothetical protein